MMIDQNPLPANPNKPAGPVLEIPVGYQGAIRVAPKCPAGLYYDFFFFTKVRFTWTGKG